MFRKDAPMPADPTISVFGTFGGRPVHEIALASPGGLTARVLTWGAVIRDLRVPLGAGRAQPVVLGLERFDDYPAHSPFFGALAGRFANRIAGGRFTLDGVTHALDRNENGATTLHGGAGGFSQAIWDIAGGDASTVTLTLLSPDGDQGFPGTLRAVCRYALDDARGLVVTLTATADRATPVSMAQHSYFNLDGSATIADHRLQVMADAYLPVDAASIPTGAAAPVAGTGFDFRAPRPIGGGGATVDHNYVLRPGPEAGLRPAAVLESPVNGLRMTVATTKPGLQVYDGSFIDVPVAGLDGRTMGRHAGLCLETQFFPDSPNRPSFPDCILRPGQTYAHETEYRFATP